MRTINARIMIMSITTLSMAACGPARHSTSAAMAGELVGGLTIFADPSDDFEFPDFEEEEGATPSGPEMTVTIEHGDPEGRKPAAWDVNTPHAATFTALTEKALDTHGAQILESVPKDIEIFCPTYASLGREQRKGVWLMIISAITKFESGYRPQVFLQEKFKNSKNEFVVSRGLLQISSESANGFGCRITKEAELHDPALNIACGVRILNRTVMKDTVITAHDERWRGGARYWSVLRKARTLGPIQRATRSLASCQPASA